jgi:hypothetical protein
MPSLHLFHRHEQEADRARRLRRRTIAARRHLGVDADLNGDGAAELAVLADHWRDLA